MFALDRPVAPTLFLALAFGLTSPQVVLAAPDNAPPRQRPSGDHDKTHEPDAGDGGNDAGAIVVTGHLPSDMGLLAGTVSIEGDDLISRSRGQIGETLAALPGVSATSFAPGVSRPVLRGFDGDRVSVLTDGIGSVDASSVSADHAVVFDDLTVDHIDVLHGPSVLLFGGQAIGGAVNAIDKRIPRTVPDSITGTVTGGYATAATERSAGGAIDMPLSERFVVHVDANWRKSDDVRTGGYIIAAPLRTDLLADAAGLEADGEHAEAETLIDAANRRGRIPNSAARSTTLGAGAAFIDAGGNLGVSVQRFDTRYGIPGRPGAHHGAAPDSEMSAHSEDAAVAIDLVQTRVDLRGAVKVGGFIDELQVRGAFGDYRHVELEGSDEGTRFAGKGLEFRADLVQSDRTAWRGRAGVHIVTRKMTVDGPEAIVPDSTTSRIAVFTLQSLRVGGGVEIEAAGRAERVAIKAQAAGYSRTFNLWSGAAGISWVPAPKWKTGVNFVHGARAPSPEELLSDGLHVATQAYERGDRSFGIEKSDGLEAYLRYTGTRGEFSLTGYATRFAHFIAAIPTGEMASGFPVFGYRQLPARYMGFEASGNHQVINWADGALRIEGSADYVHARLKGFGPAPRIPPLRLRGGVEVRQAALRVRGEVEWNDRQDRVAATEAPVPGFTHVNFSADWHPMSESGPLTLIASANNIFDVNGRRAASFTRDFVPLPGRDFRLTAKLDF